MYGSTDLAVLVALLPGALEVVVLAAGLAVVGRRLRPGRAWAQLAVAGLGLLLLGILANLTITGSILTSGSSVLGAGNLLRVLGPLLGVVQIVGLGLLVAAVVTGRPERAPAPVPELAQAE